MTRPIFDRGFDGPTVRVFEVWLRLKVIRYFHPSVGFRGPYASVMSFKGKDQVHFGAVHIEGHIAKRSQDFIYNLWSRECG